MVSNKTGSWQWEMLLLREWVGIGWLVVSEHLHILYFLYIFIILKIYIYYIKKYIFLYHILYILFVAGF